MDYAYLALSLANLSGIPVRLYRGAQFEGLYHNSKFKPDLAILEEPNIFQNPASVSYYMTADFLFYGLFRVKAEPVSLVLGPVAQIPIDQRTARHILRSIGEPPHRAAELQNYLRTIPGYPLRNFLQILCTFAYFLNGEKISVGDLLLGELEVPLPELPTTAEQNTENVPTDHNTYHLEQTLLSYIEHGYPEKLEQLFQMPAEGRAGKMAQDTLRQQKNLLIVTATLSSRAAIRGGLDQETAFTLSDLYIQKAELLNSYEGLTRLSMQMVLDFARRVAALKCGESNTRLIREARQYILTHLSEKITTEQLASALGRNRTYLCGCFKAETGMSVNEYVSAAKIEEARRLLSVTDKPLRAIAEQLGFSSQSYFQTTFKKMVGMTPLEFRAQ